MAKWAENVRFNLGSLGGLLEKIQGGGLEGTITTAAKLQVLGGNFAMGADPLAMQYEAYDDPKKYAERIKSMFGGIGTVNQVTGETTINGLEMRHIRPAAEALGMSVEDITDMIREDNKKQVVKRQVHNSNLTSDQMDAVANKAQYNKETGQWEVNMLGGGTKAVSQLNGSDLSNILSDNKDENMEKYAQSTLSSVEKIESATKFVAALLGGETYLNFIKSAEQSANNMKEAYTKNSADVSNAVNISREEALKAQMKQLQALTGIDGKLLDSYNTVKKSEDQIKRIQEILEERYGKIVAAKKNTQEKTDSLNIKYNEAINSNGGYSEGQKLQTARRDYWYAKGAEEMENGNWLSGAWNYSEGFLHNTLGRGIQGVYNTFNSVYDGAISGNGNPMTVAASSVTPIHDGNVQFAKTDPKDSAIFAKTGGPFDTLFNGIFSKVNEIYSVLPKAMSYQFPKEIIRYSESSSYNSYKTNSEANRSPIDINIHGDISIKSDGKSYDISKIIETDPIFIRKLTEIILTQIDNNVNGGKNSLWLNRPYLKY